MNLPPGGLHDEFVLDAPKSMFAKIFTTRCEKKKRELEKVCDQLRNHWLLNRSEFFSALRDQVLVSSQLQIRANLAYSVLSVTCLFSPHLINRRIA